VEAGVGGIAGDHELPVGTNIDAGQKLRQMDIEIAGQIARHMALKQQHERRPGNAECKEDRNRTRGDQAKTQRRPPHAALSAMR